MVGISRVNALEDCLLAISPIMARVVFTARYTGPSEAHPLGAQTDTMTPSPSSCDPSAQSSAEQWRSGPSLFTAEALGSNDLAPLMKVIQVYRYVEVMCIASKPGSSWSYSSHILTFYLSREIQKTQASCGHKIGELYSEWWQRTESSPSTALHLAPNLNK